MKNDFKIFNEGIVKKHLTNASLFLLAWEMLSSSILEDIRSLYIEGFRNGKDIIDKEKYNIEVICLDKDRFKAGCLWSIKMGVITQEDYVEISRLRNLRNKIAHELIEILSKEELDIRIEDIFRIKDLIKKVDQWWFVNVELTTNPSMVYIDEESIDLDYVKSGRMVAIDYLLDAYLQ